MSLRDEIALACVFFTVLKLDSKKMSTTVTETSQEPNSKKLRLVEKADVRVFLCNFFQLINIIMIFFYLEYAFNHT